MLVSDRALVRTAPDVWVLVPLRYIVTQGKNKFPKAGKVIKLEEASVLATYDGCRIPRRAPGTHPASCVNILF